MSTGTNPNSLPVGSQDRDLQTLRRGSKYLGLRETDPENANNIEGSFWIRSDLSPPEIRAQVGGVTVAAVLDPV
jgi:hypothetical protein